MRCSLVVLGMLACGPRRAPAPPAPTRTPYLMLFEQGKSFTLPSTQGQVTCTVAEVKQVGDANVSRLGCAAPHTSLLINGTWVATPAGLYHPHLPVDDPDELALLGDDELLIATVPKERDHRHALDSATESVEAFTHEGSWCVRQTTQARGGADARSWALCFDAVTLTGGSDFVRAEGTDTRIDFGKAPPHHEDHDASE